MRWVETDPQVSLRTPARRCRAEFQALFHARYRQRFGQGLPLRVCKQTVQITHQPASSSFLGSRFAVDTQMPDTFNLVSPRRELAALAEECCAALDPFSRYLGRNADGRETLAAVAMLPPDLASEFENARCAELAAMLTQAADGDGIVEIDRLTSGISDSGRLTKKDATILACVLERLGFGIEPDVRFGGRAASAGSRAVVFRLPSGAPDAPTSGYSAAALLLQLAVMVAASDGDTAPAEETMLRQHVGGALHLSEAERTRLNAHLRWLAIDPPGWAGLQRRLQALEAPQRESIARFLVEVALADGRIDPAEVKVLTRIYGHLGLDAGMVHGEIHRLSSRTTPPDEPVTVRPAIPERGHRIPPRPAQEIAADQQRSAEVPAFSLDENLIAIRLGETASVAALLAGVFAEADETADAVAVSAAARLVDGAGIEPPAPGSAGLDAPLAQLLERLGTQQAWPRGEFEAIAEQFGLLPDGALDQLNDLALDTCDACLCDGDDPIEIDADVHARLTSALTTP